MKVKHQHIAICAPNLSLKSRFISGLLKGKDSTIGPPFAARKGVLFSNETLRQFIDEEARHDMYDLTKNDHRSIRTFSSGEQKKALLNHLLSKNPDFLMLDNPFDALDIESVRSLQSRLKQLSDQMPIVQIFKRQDDLLPFIQEIVVLENEQIVSRQKTTDYLNQAINKTQKHTFGSIPKPLDYYALDSEELIRFDKVSVSYENKHVLHQISWTVKRGEFWQLKGPNGSGKTTMLSMINGDNPKAYGQNIYLFGRKKGTGESIWQIKTQIGYFSPSMMDLFKRRNTALQMVVSGLKDSIGLYSKVGKTSLKLATEWLAFIGLEHKKDCFFLELNQVDRRLILIARAMIKHPPLLILDEPSTGLDDQGAELLSAMINKMASESKTAIIYVSHRNEPGLRPQSVFRLTPSTNGSTGSVIQESS